MSTVTNVNNAPKAVGAVPIAQTSTTTVTTATTANTAPIVAQPTVINREPIVKTIQDAPIVSNIIEKQNIEVHTREVIREIHEQPIIEIEKRPEVRTIQQQVIVEREELPVREEVIGTRGKHAEIPLVRQTEVGPNNEVIMGGVVDLPPIIETIIERPIYRQVIIERHEIPVQVVYTYVPVYHPGQPVAHLNEYSVDRVQAVQQQVVGATSVVAHQQHATRVVGPVPHVSAAPGGAVTAPLPANNGNVNVVTTTQTTQVPVNIRSIRTGVAKDTWGLSDAGSLYSLGRDNQWNRVDYAPLNGKKISDFSAVKNGILWFIDDQGILHKYNPKSNSDVITPVFTSQAEHGRFSKVNAYGEEGAYILTEGGNVVNVNGSEVTTIPAQGIRHLAVGNPKKSLFSRNNFEMWGIDQNGYAQRYENNAWANKNERVRDITVGRDNSVFAVDDAGRLRKWDNKSGRFLTGSRRDNQQFSEFQSLSAYNGNKNIHGIGQNGGVFDLGNDSVIYN
ncbi:2,3-bisphosphoglycerate-independent phosphoglycerate mutase [Acrasis kona]|uniref:2,3-bisphosphoglycerate-independent phosphoglycerate mutase n=1 Tax=Acrasis kona TaxID=1008807 RepID=A0AAW2YSU5_9EUKA